MGSGVTTRKFARPTLASPPNSGLGCASCTFAELPSCPAQHSRHPEVELVLEREPGFIHHSDP